jgi:hypothetical protein
VRVTVMGMPVIAMIVIMGVTMAVDVTGRSRAIILVLVHFPAILRVCAGCCSPSAGP